MKNKKVFVMSTTEGCATNLIENSQYKEAVTQAGQTCVSTISDADVIVVNTCGYSQQMEDRAISEIKKVKSEFPEKQIVIGGCLPSISKELVQSVHKAETFRPGNIKNMLNLAGIDDSQVSLETYEEKFDPKDFSNLSMKHRVLNHCRGLYFWIENKLNRKFMPLSNIIESAIVNDEYQTITVSRGCLGECAFCSIKMAKGSVKSRPQNVLISEIKTALDKGNRKLWLLGDDIGCYGQDIGTDIVSLLEEILQIDEEFELVVNYVEPMFLERYYERFCKVLKDKRIININFPLQSGSKRIVYSMRRFYHPENILKMMEEIRQGNQSLVRKTNLIVGYPSETWGDFFKTIKSVFSFDALVAFRFTPRKFTLAAKMPEQLPDNIIEMRFWLVNIAIFIRHCIVAITSLFRVV